MTFHRMWDPLYGRIDLTKFEGQLLSLPEVQRLRYVRMCNINSLFITGASEVSRFEHTVGVLYLARLWATENQLSTSERSDLTAAAVLHDVFTGPFGHSFQYVLEDLHDNDNAFFHEDVALGATKNYYMRLTTAAQFAGVRFGAMDLLQERWSEVSAIIDGSAPLGPLVAGTMDLDNLDNVVRLAYHAGLATREDVAAVERVSRGINISKHSGCLRVLPTILEDIIQWQNVRQRLYEFLLLDWGEFAAKAMLTRAVERGIEDGILGANSWSYTDSEFLDQLAQSGVGEQQDVRDLVRRLRCGDLYWPMLMGRSANVGSYVELSRLDVKMEISRRVEESVLRPFGMATGVIFHLILDVGKTQRAVKVDLGDGHVREVGSNSNAVLAGVFLARPWSEGSRSLRHAREKLRVLLDKAGLGELVGLEDPMGVQREAGSAQLPLL